MPEVKKLRGGVTASRVPVLSRGLLPAGNGVLSRIVDASDEQDDYLSILVYGRSGTGKTTLWSTFPGPKLAIVCSGGLKPGELKSISKEDLKGVKKVVLNESTEMLDLVAHVRESGAYSTVVLDHASGFQDLILKEILGLDEVPVHKSWGLAQQQQYGQCAVMFKEYVRGLLNLNCNVVIVAQERNFSEEGSTGDVIQPCVAAALMPSVTGWLNPACDYVVQTYLRPKTVMKATGVNDKKGKPVMKAVKAPGAEFCLRTLPHEVYMTKFRVPKGHKLPPDIVDPTYDKILSIIRGG